MFRSKEEKKCYALSFHGYESSLIVFLPEHIENNATGRTLKSNGIIDMILHKLITSFFLMAHIKPENVKIFFLCPINETMEIKGRKILLFFFLPVPFFVPVASLNTIKEESNSNDHRKSIFFRKNINKLEIT